MKSFGSCLRATFLAATACSWACTGSLGGEAGPSGTIDSHGTPPAGGKGGSSGSSVPPGGLIDDGPKAGGTTPGANPPGGAASACSNAAGSAVPAVSRVVRLTRQQYINSVRDLTGVTTTEDIPTDATFDGFNRGNDLEIPDKLAQIYRTSAEGVAKQIVSTPALLKSVTGCDAPGNATCAGTFIANFGKRAFRRELTADEKTKLTALYNSAGDLVETGDAFTKGVQVVLEVILQSPKFLHRIETSNTKDANGLIALSSWEIASRLSFTIANTMPDTELQRAAGADELRNPDNVVAQAKRLIGGAAGRATVRDFHRQWLRTDGWTIHLDKDMAKYPTVTPAALPTFSGELEAYSEEVAFTQKKGLTTLLTAPFAFVTKLTAPMYGLQASNFTDTPKKADLEPARRAGVITQVGFLAGNALSSASSPIHRGVAIQRYLLCTPIPDPTVQVPPPPVPTGTKTTRQAVVEATADATCKACHENLINPIGFGLENFDAVGAWRDKDNGQPVDATGKINGTAEARPFTNAVELAKAIAESPESRGCYVSQWWRYTFGRKEAAGDACAIETLGKSVSGDAYTATDLLVDMTRTKAFMFRNSEGQ